MLSTCLCALPASANIVLFGRYFHIDADFKGQAGTSHTFIDPSVYLQLCKNKTDVPVSHEQSTQSIRPLFCAFPRFVFQMESN